MDQKRLHAIQLALYKTLRTWEEHPISIDHLSELSNVSLEDAKGIMLNMLFNAPGEMAISITDDHLVVSCGVPSLTEEGKAFFARARVQSKLVATKTETEVLDLIAKVAKL